MPPADRRVLHVLPHAGGGGDTYVDMLEGMPGYAFTRVRLAPARKPGPLTVARGLGELARNVRGHDLVHVHGEITAALFLPLLALRPSVVTLHGLHFLRRADEGVPRKAAELNLRAVARVADRTICVSNAEHEILQTVAPPATEAKPATPPAAETPPPAQGLE